MLTMTLCEELSAVVGGVPHLIANLANASALIYDAMPDVNWVGFYLMEDGRLVLGPFQGKVACVEIAIGKGVCGTAVQRDATLLVPDVHSFSGHIACDSASNSEIVIPLHRDGKVVGVLDIDSPLLDRFSDRDREVLENCVKVLESELSFPV